MFRRVTKHLRQPRVALLGTEGETRDGDRLDKAGQPGGPVSAVYSPAAAFRHQGVTFARRPCC